jgi:hypothetical protein
MDKKHELSSMESDENISRYLIIIGYVFSSQITVSFYKSRKAAKRLQKSIFSATVLIII